MGARLLGKVMLAPLVVLRSARAPWPVRVAQGLSLVGDLALEGRSRGRFLVGVGAFLGAQLGYGVALRRRSTSPLLGTPARRRLLGAGTGGAAVAAVLAHRADPVLALPVAAYGVALARTVTAAVSVDAGPGRTGAVRGASLFWLSDALIGVRRFLLHDGAPPVGMAVAATYAAAQWCLAGALAQPGSTTNQGTRHRPVAVTVPAAYGAWGWYSTVPRAGS